MAKTDKPNILVIWGDDIGISNLSCYSNGLMGYKTPNIDRLAKEGMRFTDSYGEQSCTAGRSSFITGQSCYRTGLSKVGVPAAPQGMMAEDPDVAFACGMIPHHQAAITMAEVELQYGDDDQMKEMAQAIIDAQRQEIEELTSWIEGHAQ